MRVEPFLIKRVINAREAEFIGTGGTISWRYKGDSDWIPIVNSVDLTPDAEFRVENGILEAQTGGEESPWVPLYDLGADTRAAAVSAASADASRIASQTSASQAAADALSASSDRAAAETAADRAASEASSAITSAEQAQEDAQRAETASGLAVQYGPLTFTNSEAFLTSGIPGIGAINKRAGTQDNSGVWDIVAAGTGDFNHPVTGVGVLVPRNRQVTVEDFGATGDDEDKDTLAFQRALDAIGDDGNIFCRGPKYRIADVINLHGDIFGKRLHLMGAHLFMQNDAASVHLGDPGSGLLMGGGGIYPVDGYTGDAVVIRAKPRSAPADRGFVLSGGDIVCSTNEAGRAVVMEVLDNEHRIAGLRSHLINIGGFEHGVVINSAAPEGVGFVNDNEFHGLRIAGNTRYGVTIDALETGINESSGNGFFGLQTQFFADQTQKNIWVKNKLCKRNKFIGVEPWDISGATGAVVVDDAGDQTMWFGSVMTSNGVSVLSPTAIGIIANDAGSERSMLLLGSRKISENKEELKTQTFNSDDLMTLDVRNGPVMIEGTVETGTRLTNIIHGGVGQEVTVIFGGNTFLSDAWGGTGQIYTKDRVSRTPVTGEVSKFVFDGSVWREIGTRNETGVPSAETSFSVITSSLNTSGKFTGKQVWDTTNNRMMRARGPEADDPWDVIDGSDSVTPA